MPHGKGESPETDRALGAPAALVSVDRAAADLRRGLGVVVTDGGGGAAVALSAELLREEALGQLRGRGAGARLILTENRARVLNILPSGGQTVRIPLSSRMTAALIQSLADPTSDLDHPLRGPFDREKGPDHETDIAAVKLAKIARLLPAIVGLSLSAEVTDGAAAEDWAKANDLLVVPAGAVMAYDVRAATSLVEVAEAHVPLDGAENARIRAFRPLDGGIEHFAILIGTPAPGAPVLARIHSECFTGDLLGSLKCDCGQQLRGAIRQIAAEGAGILLYLSQEGRGIGIINKLRAYALQDEGYDTVEANHRMGFEADERIFLPAVEILRHLGITRVRLLTNNPDKVAALETLGVTVAERVPHAFPANDHNAFYLSTKARKGGHLL